MSDNIIYISVGGRKYTNWTSVKIDTSLETLTSSFTLSVVDKNIQKENSDWPIRPQDECIIFIGGEKIITGYIDELKVNVTKDSHIINIVGRDKTSDIVDCN